MFDQRKKLNPQTQILLQMSLAYPFHQNLSSNIKCQVKHRKYFNHSQYDQFRSKIDFHSKIKHPSLIKIIKGFQSKKEKYFDIFFEYVPHNIRNYIKILTPQQIQISKVNLLSICTYLISYNIYPEISELNLGYCQDKKIKLYVPIDFNKLTSVNSKELIKIKQIQINNIFNQYLMQAELNRVVFLQKLERQPLISPSRSQQNHRCVVNFNYRSPPNRQKKYETLQKNCSKPHNIYIQTNPFSRIKKISSIPFAQEVTNSNQINKQGFQTISRLIYNNHKNESHISEQIYYQQNQIQSKHATPSRIISTSSQNINNTYPIQLNLVVGNQMISSPNLQRYYHTNTNKKINENQYFQMQYPYPTVINNQILRRNQQLIVQNQQQSKKISLNNPIYQNINQNYHHSQKISQKSKFNHNHATKHKRQISSTHPESINNNPSTPNPPPSIKASNKQSSKKKSSKSYANQVEINPYILNEKKIHNQQQELDYQQINLNNSQQQNNQQYVQQHQNQNQHEQQQQEIQQDYPQHENQIQQYQYENQQYNPNNQKYQQNYNQQYYNQQQYQNYQVIQQKRQFQKNQHYQHAKYQQNKIKQNTYQKNQNKGNKNGYNNQYSNQFDQRSRNLPNNKKMNKQIQPQQNFDGLVNKQPTNIGRIQKQQRNNKQNKKIQENINYNDNNQVLDVLNIVKQQSSKVSKNKKKSNEKIVSQEQKYITNKKQQQKIKYLNQQNIFKETLPQKKERDFMYDHQSLDTYHQQLGQFIQMPKMIVTQLRQTTKSPPKIKQGQQKRGKLHQSVGLHAGKYMQQKTKRIEQEQQKTQASQDYKPDQRFKKKNGKYQKQSGNNMNYNTDQYVKKMNLVSQEQKNRDKNNIESKKIKMQQIPQQRSRQNLYRMNFKQQQTNHQAKKSIYNQTDYLYKQTFKIQKDDPLTRQFNHLFDSQQIQKQNNQDQYDNQNQMQQDNNYDQHDSNYTQCNDQSQLQNERKNFQQQQQIEQEPEYIQINKRSPRSNEINERVKMALQKSEATLQFFNKFKSAKANMEK